MNPRTTNPIPSDFENREQSLCDIELPQSIIESYARFLVPEIRKFCESENAQRTLAEQHVEETVKAAQPTE